MYSRGLKDIIKSIQRMPGMADKSAKKSLKSCSDKLLVLSRPLVPINTGKLRWSGEVQDNGPFEKIVVYSAIGEDGLDYAMTQHENLDFRHLDGQAKYLQEPFELYIERFLEDFEETAKGEMSYVLR